MQDHPSELLVRNLLEVFNERDENKRLAVIQQIYTESAIFFEMAESFQGFEAINRQVTAVLATLPAEATFRTAGPQTMNHNLARLPWVLSAGDGPVMASGMDVAIVEGERIAALYLFIDPPSGTQ